ncbi:MAG: hypothetical protein M1827_001872 [Pycnora praestabilis]|nr:MAG: hypothetical protein M1827_001872 [Pycnora praestabilis]
MPIVDVRAEDSRQLQAIADVLAGSKKVVVITGAGISTNCGIPDFRSENGLYSIIQKQDDTATESKVPASLQDSAHPPAAAVKNGGSIEENSTQILDVCQFEKRPLIPSNIKGKDLFDAALWKNPVTTSVFYTFIASLRKKIKEDIQVTTTTHRFIRILRDTGRLVRCYTQNIDGLEARDGLCSDLTRGKGSRTRFAKKVVDKPRPLEPVLPGHEVDGGCEVVQLHGDLERLRCILCQGLCNWDEESREKHLLNGKAPNCSICVEKDQDRRDRGKRGVTIGTLRPNIVLYGEEHPSSSLLGPLTTHDIAIAPDVLLIMGTSLKVHGLKTLVREFSKAVHAQGGVQGRVIFVNQTKPPESVWNEVIDWWVGMDCDVWVQDLRERRKDIWQHPSDIRTVVNKASKPGTSKTEKKDPNCEELAILAEATENEDKENMFVEKARKRRRKDPTVFPLMENPQKTRVEAPTARVGKSPKLDSAPSCRISTTLKSSQGTLSTSTAKMSFSTPSRKRKSTLCPLQEPLTPPPSGRAMQDSTGSVERRVKETFDTEGLWESPSKRRMLDVVMWKDVDEDHNHTVVEDSEPDATEEEHEMIWHTFPKRMSGQNEFVEPTKLPLTTIRKRNTPEQDSKKAIKTSQGRTRTARQLDPRERILSKASSTRGLSDSIGILNGATPGNHVVFVV